MNLAYRHDFEFVIKECGTCGVLYGLTLAFFDGRKKSGETWHCPNGHEWCVRKTKLQELEEQIAAEQRRTEMERNRRQAAENETRATRGQLTKLRNRIEKGVCPHCQRTFQNVARHMQTKHADHVV